MQLHPQNSGKTFKQGRVVIWMSPLSSPFAPPMVPSWGGAKGVPWGTSNNFIPCVYGLFRDFGGGATPLITADNSDTKDYSRVDV